MSHTTFQNPLPEAPRAHMARGHRPDGRLVADHPVFIGHIAAGGLWTTASEYATLVMELQRAILGRSDRILPQELASQLVQPQASDRYGLGFFLHDRAGTKLYFSHIGDGAGYVGGFASHRGRGNAAVVLTNGVRAVNLCREVLRSVATVYDWPDFLPRTRPNLPLTDAELAAVVGRYRVGVDDVCVVERDDQGLQISGPGLPGYRLYRAAADTFVCQERDGELVVAIPAAGSVASIQVNLADEIGRFQGPARPAQRMADDERTPLELLRAGDVDPAIAAYRQWHAVRPEAPELAESRLNRLGYQLLGSQQTAAARAVFQLNVDLYGSANTYDSLAEAELALGDREASRRHYQRSLELNPGNANARQQLEMMVGDRE